MSHLVDFCHSSLKGLGEIILVSNAHAKHTFSQDIRFELSFFLRVKVDILQFFSHLDILQEVVKKKLLCLRNDYFFKMYCP